MRSLEQASPCFEEGRAAFAAGSHPSSCPYEGNTFAEVEWMDGYDAAQVEQRNKEQKSGSQFTQGVKRV